MTKVSGCYSTGGLEKCNRRQGSLEGGKRWKERWVLCSPYQLESGNVPQSSNREDIRLSIEVPEATGSSAILGRVNVKSLGLPLDDTSCPSFQIHLAHRAVPTLLG